MSRIIQPNNKMNLMLVPKDHYTHLFNINNDLLEEFKSDKVIWSNDEKYIYYLEKLSFYSYQITNQRKRKLKLYVSDILKVVGNLIYGAPKKRNNQNTLSLYELNRRKIIRSFINIDVDSSIRLRFYKNINLIQGNQIFVHYILRFSCYLYAYVLYYNLCTGQKLISSDYLNNLKGKNFLKSNHFSISISNNGLFIGLHSQQKVFIFKQQSVLVKQFHAEGEFKFSECSQYFLRYNLNEKAQIYVYDIQNDIEKEYMLEYELLFIKITDKLMHTIQKHQNKMIYIKINL